MTCLTWPRKSPKFNLHHLRKISTGLKMAVLTQKLGIYHHTSSPNFKTVDNCSFFSICLNARCCTCSLLSTVVLKSTYNYAYIFAIHCGIFLQVWPCIRIFCLISQVSFQCHEISSQYFRRIYYNLDDKHINYPAKQGFYIPSWAT